jgi:hypothetical protein
VTLTASGKKEKEDFERSTMKDLCHCNLTIAVHFVSKMHQIYCSLNYCTNKASQKLLDSA